MDKELAHSELRTQAEQALSQQVEHEVQLAAEQATQNQHDAAAWQNGAAAAMKEGYETAATEIVSLRLQLEQADEEKASLSRKLASQRILTQSLSREGKPCLWHPQASQRDRHGAAASTVGIYECRCGAPGYELVLIMSGSSRARRLQ
eukprot:COSAG01_NODE_505_length_16132_cov_49.751528_4_plen_148_part_00